MSVSYIRYIHKVMAPELEKHYKNLTQSKSLSQFKKDELIFILAYHDIDFSSSENKSELLSKIPRDILRDELLTKLLNDD